MKRSILLTLTLCILTTAAAFSELFVDTGRPDGPNAVSLDSGGGFSASAFAAAFTTTTNYSLTQIDGFLRRPIVNGESQITVAIYADDAGGNIPGSELYTIKYDVAHAGDPRYADHSWQLVSGLDWYLTAGTHWVSFEVRGDDDYAGSMVMHSPTGLVNEVSRNASGWNDYDEVNIGVRLTGDVVPEPAVALLFGTGLITAYVLRRNKKAATYLDD